MFKKTGNPQVEELTKSCTERRVNLSDIRAIKVGEIRKCAWCGEGRLHSGNQKYCTKSCSSSAMAWANPQKEEGLNFLLIRQDWKCAGCLYDYRPLADEIFVRMHSYMGDRFDGSVFGKSLDFVLMKRLKNKVVAERLPEVDHIIPISKGGQALGHDNHQAICYTCHKAKTKKDLSGPRKRKDP